MITKRCHTCGSVIRNASMDESCESCEQLTGMFDPQVGDDTYRTTKPIQSSIVKQLIETHSSKTIYHENPRYASTKKEYEDNNNCNDEFMHFGTCFTSIESNDPGEVLEDIHIAVIRNRAVKKAGTIISQMMDRIKILAKYLRNNKISFPLLPITELDMKETLSERGIYL